MTYDTVSYHATSFRIKQIMRKFFLKYGNAVQKHNGKNTENIQEKHSCVKTGSIIH